MNPYLDTSYEPFSRETEYIELNRQFIESMNLHGCRQVLDVACGTGTLTEFIWHVMQQQDASADVEIVGIDLSRQSLHLAVEHMSSLGTLSPDRRANSVIFVEGSADCLPLHNQVMDAAVMGNAIHILDDKERLVREIHRVLSRGGIFGFNSSFYAGTFAPKTERFYTEWMKEALMYILRKDAEQRQAGLSGVTRTKGRAAAAFSRPWLSPDDYVQLLNRCEFRVESINQRTIWMSQRSFETVGAYAGLATVLLSGYPAELACEALERSVGNALVTVQMNQIPRYWLEIIATKR